MFLSKIKILLPTKKLIVELALRNGSASSESPSPYDGCLSYTMDLLNKLTGGKGDFVGSYYALLDQQPDYNADKQCPVEGEYDSQTYIEETKPSEYEPSTGKEAYYLRRLEDIDRSWVLQYIGNVIYGAVFNQSQSVKKFEKDNSTVSILIDEEDGEVIQASELLVEGDGDYSAIEVAKACEKIPYLLRRLHDKSKQLHISVISLLIAYEKAKRAVALDHQMNSRRSENIQPRHLLREGVYSMNVDGSLGGRLGADANNRSKYFKDAKMWLFGVEGYVDEYYNDAVELLHYYDVMDIDITNEDPATYQEDYISQLTILYISSNREYVQRKRNGFHKEVYNALKEIPLEFYEQPQEEEQDEYDIIENTMNVFNSSSFMSIERSNDFDEHGPNLSNFVKKSINTFFGFFNVVYKASYNPNKMIQHNGFYFTKMETPLMLDLSYFTGFDLVLVHSSGYLVKKTESHRTLCLDVQVATEALSDYMNTGSGKIALSDWKEIHV